MVILHTFQSFVFFYFMFCDYFPLSTTDIIKSLFYIRNLNRVWTTISFICNLFKITLNPSPF
ncbi:hypothetical protein STK_26195 [Sulfurisphaera tokodaii str. 7]|uniref:Uncharacterized protein n=1 Tax=Sulfurisphaera tokodaii (strain DSM 16993 / JCM 10545 / NBRC 100140 / 7) TaxID=273063 RepID=Q96X91_SULTO|nr:hypothetical protein STK_26195 [Sulfurisphaera tokodaii str. 7]